MLNLENVMPKINENSVYQLLKFEFNFQLIFLGFYKLGTIQFEGNVLNYKQI